MTPAARVQAAIDILDQWLGGQAALEQALTGWARRSRFAGSKDRAAVRDLVFDAARRRRSDAARGGAETGRGVMLGHLRRSGTDPASVFGAGGHAPSELSAEELAAGRDPAPGAEALDLPDWLWPIWQRSLGAAADATAARWQSRAPVHLRVNIARVSREAAMDHLRQDGIEAEPHPACDWALSVVTGSRKIRQSGAYLSGEVELQDAASQALVAAIPDLRGASVLDYCAGGGGKSLALAAAGAGRVVAHDAAPARMRDLPARAQRAGAKIKVSTSSEVKGQFDVVLCDVPCSGSGSWRRAPEGKWALTEAKLRDLSKLQADILRTASQFLRPDGLLVYATCSVLDVENQSVIAQIKGREVVFSHQWGLSEDTDGFFSAHMK